MNRSRAVGSAIAGLVLASVPAGASAEAQSRPPAPLVRSAAAVPGHYIVVLAPTTGKAQVATVADVASAHGGTVGYRYHAAIQGFAAALSPAAVHAVRAEPDVAFVEQDGWASVPRNEKVSTTQQRAIWNLDRIDQRYLPLDKAYTYDSNGSGVTAYVLDTGVWFTHPEFGGRARSGYDFVDDDADALDCNGHGTHVAGTISGRRFGVAKRIDVVALRVIGCNGRGPFSTVVAGVDWVTANAQHPAVANLSLGGVPNGAVDRAVTNSIRSGVTYAIAAGNDSADACNYSPARVPLALTVGAIGHTDRRAGFSNYGSCLDLFAPGVDIRSAWPADTGITNEISGTSFAAPHVAGAAALYLDLHPNATPAQVRNAVVGGATAGRLGAVGPGSPNALLYSRVG